MSKERQRRRAALEQQRAKPGAKKRVDGAKAAASERTAPTGKVKTPARTRPGSKGTVYRQRRFKPLPMKLKVPLAIGYVLGVIAILLFTPTWTGRIGLLVVLTMLVPLIVVIVRDPTRRTR